jgi:hypothetical protein
MNRVDTFCTDESMQHYDHEEEERKMELNYIQERAEEEDSIFTESLTGQQTKRDQLTQKDSVIGYKN